jgi:hypothetical protein
MVLVYVTVTKCQCILLQNYQSPSVITELYNIILNSFNE